MLHKQCDGISLVVSAHWVHESFAVHIRLSTSDLAVRIQMSTSDLAVVITEFDNILNH